MRIWWNKLPTEHSCGTEGTILGVCASQDSEIAFSCVCIFCAKEFTITTNFAAIVSECAVQDFLKNRATTPEEMLMSAQVGGDN